jgi:hypothetical protein
MGPGISFPAACGLLLFFYIHDVGFLKARRAAK